MIQVILFPTLYFSKSNFVYLQLSISRAGKLVTQGPQGTDRVVRLHLTITEVCAGNEILWPKGNISSKVFKVAPVIRLLSSFYITRHHHDSQLCEQQQHRGFSVVHVWRQRERMAGLSAYRAPVQQQHMSAWVKYDLLHEICAALGQKLYVNIYCRYTVVF